MQHDVQWFRLPKDWSLLEKANNSLLWLHQLREEGAIMWWFCVGPSEPICACWFSTALVPAADWEWWHWGPAGTPEPRHAKKKWSAPLAMVTRLYPSICTKLLKYLHCDVKSRLITDLSWNDASTTRTAAQHEGEFADLSQTGWNHPSDVPRARRQDHRQHQHGHHELREMGE